MRHTLTAAALIAFCAATAAAELPGVELQIKGQRVVAEIAATEATRCMFASSVAGVMTNASSNEPSSIAARYSESVGGADVTGSFAARARIITGIASGVSLREEFANKILIGTTRTFE